MFGAPLGTSTGECVFCGTTLKVTATVERVGTGGADAGREDQSARKEREAPVPARRDERPDPVFVVRRGEQSDLIY